MKSTKVKVLGAAAGLLLLLGITNSGDKNDTKKDAGSTPTTEQVADAPQKPAHGFAAAANKLGDEFGDDLRSIEKSGRVIDVKLNADENLTNGLTLGGMERDAGKVFKIVADADAIPGEEIMVELYLPLTNTATGQESNDRVNIFVLTHADAEQIDWSNADTIDWENYRTFVHPALR